MSPTLLITNDFPPRVGGIERYCRALADLLDGDVVVLTSSTPGRRAAERGFDRDQSFVIVRRGPILLPTPATLRAARALLTTTRATTVIFGAAAPLGLLGPALRRFGATRIVACTHGHEAWWARLPVTRRALRRIVAGADVVTVVSGYTQVRIAAALPEGQRSKLRPLPPPLRLPDAEPAPQRSSGAATRGTTAYRHVPGTRPGTPAPPLVLSVGRLVRRKGFDTLIRSWPQVVDPAAELAIVGEGPERRRLERLIRASPCRDRIHLVGAVDDARLELAYADADLFALPCRSVRAGLEAEGFGYVIAEAQARGLPVVVGDSGGAPDAVDPGRSGILVPTDGIPDHGAGAVAAAINALLADPERRARMGDAGRSYVERFAYPEAGATLRRALGVTD